MHPDFLYKYIKALSAIQKCRHWLQTKNTFEKSRILEKPTKDMYKAMIKFICEIGKASLMAYGIFEE